MPSIQRYERKQTISGEAPSALANPSALAAPGQAVTGFGNTLTDILDQKRQELKKQEDDNFLTAEGTKLNNSYIDFKTQLEKDPQYQSGNYEGMSKALADFSKKQLETYKVTQDERPELYNKILAHTSSLENSLRGHFATLASSRIKINGEAVRKSDLESSMQIARSGDYALGITNYQKTLESQKTNGLLSPELYDFELKTGRSKIAEAHIENLVQKDPTSAKAVFNAFNGEKVLLAETAEKLDKLLKPAVTRQTGIDVGREVYRSDTTGNLEAMINTVKDKKLDAETEKHAIDEIKDSWNVRKTQEVEIARNAVKKVNTILVPLAMKNGGINKMGDLTPGQWSELERDNPEYAAQLQDRIRREQNEVERERRAEIREARVEARAARQERLLIQSENENAIMLDPDFRNRDIDKDFALGNITREGRNRLIKLQEQQDPMKHEAVKRAIQKINSGTALQEALNITDKSKAAVWKQKYGDVVKAFAYNNFDKPDFEKNLSEFIEKQVFSDLVTSWFATDEQDRQTRLTSAQRAAGPLPQKKAKQSGPKAGTVVDGYRFKGGDPSKQANWEKI